jgi:hypothetical protein
MASAMVWVAREMLSRSDGTLFYEPMPSEEDGWTAYPGLSGEKAAGIAFHVYRKMLRELERRDAEIERLKGGRRPAAKRKRGHERGIASHARDLKRLWKRQIRQGRGLVSRLWFGTKPKPEILG